MWGRQAARRGSCRVRSYPNDFSRELGCAHGGEPGADDLGTCSPRACAHVRTGSGGRVTGPAPGEHLGPADADIADPDTYTAGVPHATFQRLRRDDPVSWWGDDHAGGHGFWAVTRHADLLSVSRDVDRFSSSRGIRLEEMDAEETEARRTMMELDPPAHTAYRRLVSKPFSRREVYAYENAIRLLARGWSRRRWRRERASTSSTASPSSSRCGCSAGCWVCRTTTARGSSSGATHCSATPTRSSRRIRSTSSTPRSSGCCRSAAQWASSCSATREEQARARRDNPTDDVISDLLRPKIDGETLSEHEFNNFFTLLVAAGNDTTCDTMTAGIKALVERPDQLAEFARRDRRGERRRGRLGGRGDPPLGLGDDALPPHRRGRHHARRARDQGRGQGGDLVRVGRLRRGRVRRSVHVRRPPVAQPPGRVRVR